MSQLYWILVVTVMFNMTFPHLPCKYVAELQDVYGHLRG